MTEAAARPTLSRIAELNMSAAGHQPQSGDDHASNDRVPQIAAIDEINENVSSPIWLVSDYL